MQELLERYLSIQMFSSWIDAKPQNDDSVRSTMYDEDECPLALYFNEVQDLRKIKVELEMNPHQGNAITAKFVDIESGDYLWVSDWPTLFVLLYDTVTDTKDRALTWAEVQRVLYLAAP